MTLSLQATAGLVGGYCWVERRLFEVLGAWSTTVPDASATIVLDRHAQHAAWRAEQWWDRLPVLAGVDRESLVAPPPGWAALADAVALGRPTTAVEASGGAGAEAEAAAGAGAAGDAAGVRAAADAAGDGGVDRLAVAYRVLLPRLAVSYARHRQVVSAVSDGSVLRTLHQVAADVGADWLEGESALQQLLVDPAPPAAAVLAAERRFTSDVAAP